VIRHPEIKRELYHGEFWSDGGYVGIVGEGINADIIRDYIKKQGRKTNQLKLVDFVQGGWFRCLTLPKADLPEGQTFGGRELHLKNSFNFFCLPKFLRSQDLFV